MRHALAARVRRRHRQRRVQSGGLRRWVRGEARLHHERRRERRPLESRGARALRRRRRLHAHRPAEHLRRPRHRPRRCAPWARDLDDRRRHVRRHRPVGGRLPRGGGARFPRARRARRNVVGVRFLPRLRIGADGVLERAPEFPGVPRAVPRVERHRAREHGLHLVPHRRCRARAAWAAFGSTAFSANSPMCSPSITVRSRSASRMTSVDRVDVAPGPMAPRFSSNCSGEPYAGANMRTLPDRRAVGPIASAESRGSSPRRSPAP